jgi:hypothetical protein
LMGIGWVRRPILLVTNGFVALEWIFVFMEIMASFGAGALFDIFGRADSSLPATAGGLGGSFLATGSIRLRVEHGGDPALWRKAMMSHLFH